MVSATINCGLFRHAAISCCKIGCVLARKTYRLLQNPSGILGARSASTFRSTLTVSASFMSFRYDPCQRNVLLHLAALEWEKHQHPAKGNARFKRRPCQLRVGRHDIQLPGLGKLE